MKRLICLVVSLVLASPAAYAEDPKPSDLTDPLEILQKVDAAAKAVKNIKYDVVVEAPAAIAAQVGFQKVEATFIIITEVKGTPKNYFVDAKIYTPGAAEPKRVTAGSDNDMSFIIDHQGKIAYEDIDPAVMGPVGGIIQRAGMIEFIHPTPFTDEINGKSREMRDSEKVGGEDCYVVHVVYAAEQAPQGTWSFSKKDFLPRKRVDAFTPPGGQPVSQTKIVTNLVLDPKVDETIFKLKLPEGYTKTDDFAPNFLVRRQPPA